MVRTNPIYDTQESRSDDRQATDYGRDDGRRRTTSNLLIDLIGQHSSLSFLLAGEVKGLGELAF